MFKSFIFIICFLLLITLGKVYFQPVSLVVPHHNLVIEKRNETLLAVKEKRPLTKKIIILSPDHFSNDQKSVYYSNLDWSFINSKVDYDKDFNKFLQANLKLNSELVKSDHGVFNIVADIGSIWPGTKVVPIIIGQEIKFKDLDFLLNALSEYCTFDCLLISSVDFSHYLPYKLANIHDQEALQSLINLDLKSETQIEVDSPQSIYLLVNFSKNKKALSFNLFEHTNSAELVENSDAESTGHFFGWYTRGILKNDTYEVKTYTHANKIFKKDSISTLGARFFYGVDEFDFDTSSIKENFVVAGYEDSRKAVKVYLPLLCNKGVCTFARGDERKKLLQLAYPEVDNERGEIVISKN